MFDKRRENNDPVSAPAAPHNPVGAPAPARRSSPVQAAVGPTIVVKGEISGEEDIVIAGRCEGSISLPKNTVTVLSDGHVQADVEANAVEIEGQVEGDVSGVDKVLITATGRMEGNIKAPRVILNDGAKFKGSIDMDPGIGQAAKPPPKRHPEKSKLTGDGRPMAPAQGKLPGGQPPLSNPNRDR